MKNQWTNRIFNFFSYMLRHFCYIKAPEVKYLFFLPEADYYSVVCQDLFQRKDCFIIHENFYMNPDAFYCRIFRWFHFPEKFVLFFYEHMPFRFFLYPPCPKVKQKTFAVFYQVYRGAYDLPFRKYLKKKCNVDKTVLILTNPLSCSTNIPSTGFLKKNFDFILSDDVYDCEKNGFVYWEDNFSYVKIPETEQKRSDIFFVGSSKGRLPILHKIYHFLCKNGFNPVFYITDVPLNQQKFKGIHYNEPISYHEVLQYVSGCKIILEVIQNHQLGLTLRTQEALTYNKKLLTNSSYVLKKSYYSPQNIHFFSDVSEINIDWLNSNDPAVYSNKPDFSAKNLIDFVNKQTKRKEKKGI